MSKSMYVYSGKCRQGRCGDKTNLTSSNENELFIGDIVLINHRDKNGFMSTYGLSAVVCNKYTTYGGGIHKVSNPVYKSFVMGIISVDYMADDSEWYVERVKSFSDVVDGEGWPACGFNYKVEDEG